jgi:hypothetical protein
MKAEWLLIIIPLFMFFIWAIWYNLTNKWYNWRYKPEYDKSRRFPVEDTGIGKPTFNFTTPGRVDEGRKLEITSPLKTGQNSKSPRGFFATRRRS